MAFHALVCGLFLRYLDSACNGVRLQNDCFWGGFQIVLVPPPFLVVMCSQQASGLTPMIFFHFFSLSHLIFMPDALNFQSSLQICISFRFGLFFIPIDLI